MTPYILHVAIILAGCLAFYKILLQRETFFRLNRMVLLCCLVLSFGVPLLPVPQQWSLRDADPAIAVAGAVVNPTFRNEGNAINDDHVTAQTSTEKKGQTDASGQLLPTGKTKAVNESSTQINATLQTRDVPRPLTLAAILKWSLYLYWFGVAAFGINFLLQIGVLYYRAYSKPVIKDGKFRIIEMSGDSAPCSFGNNIFINPEKYDWDTYSQILIHEKVHIQQGHTIDIILAEIVLIFQWFNPFAWYYRKELECNLEFLTDSKILEEAAVDKSAYQVSLLKVSAPHFPLSLTTNYNQSLLKKRLVMMNAKRSNINTTWKYFFLVPLMLVFMCALNKPVVYGQSPNTAEQKKTRSNSNGIDTEGAWFATVKGDKVSVQFKKDDENNNSYNNNSFPLSDFKDRETASSFTIKRDAGSMVLTGKFEGQQGMGRYKFTGDKGFATFLAEQGVKDSDEEDLMVYFFVELDRNYVQMIKRMGYNNVQKHDLIPLAALKIDEAYIQSLKSAGYSQISVQDLIPFKSLGIDGAYIQDIQKAGYKNVTAGQLISFKAQGIDGKYIADVRASNKLSRSSDENDKNASDNNNANSNNSGKNKLENDKSWNKSNNKNVDDDNDNRRDDGRRDEADYIISYKALHIDGDYVRSIQDAGFPNISKSNIISMKAQGISADYIKNLKSQGYPDISASNVIAMKAQNITADFAKSFKEVGLQNISASNLISMKAVGVTADYIKGINDAGFNKVSADNVISMRAQNITPAVVKEYAALGFENLSINDIISAKATGTTPQFITSMKEKGHNLKSINKYVQLKVVID